MNDDQSHEEERISYLATGFAAGGLDETEKVELYDLLRRPGEAGAHAARIAWCSLQVAVDLRGSLGTHFQDTVTHRLKNPTDTGPGGQFVPDVYARLGITRPRLEDVPVPVATSPAVPRHIAWRRVVLVGAASVLLSWGALHFLFPLVFPPGGRLARSTGSVTRSGVLIAPGAALETEPVAVSAGGLAEVSLGNGGRVRIRGPASVVVQPAGLAVVSGEAWAEATSTALVIGLPDGRLSVHPSSRVAIVVTANRATIATIAGTVVLTRGNSTVGVSVPVGRATTTGEQTFPWQPSANAICSTKNGVRTLVHADPSCATWVLTASFAPRTLDDIATIDAGSHFLRLGAGWLEVDGDLRQPLTGAPLVARALRIERTADGIVRLHLEGLRSTVQTLKWDSVPQTLTGGGLTDVCWGSGPDAEPDL